MRKQQIEKIAQAVNDAREAVRMEGHPLPRQTVQIFDSVARTLADVLATETPKFQRSKFLAQCGVEGVVAPVSKIQTPKPERN